MSNGVLAGFASIQCGELILRPFRLSDADALFHIQDTNQELFEPVSPLRDVLFYSTSAQAALIEEDEAKWRADLGYALAVEFRTKLVGRVALSNVVRAAWQNATLGYWIDGAFQSRGIATMAVDGALALAFGSAGLHRVQAAVMPGNGASIRVVEKNGFAFEGLARQYLRIQGMWQDHNIYSVTQERYVEKNTWRVNFMLGTQER